MVRVSDFVDASISNAFVHRSMDVGGFYLSRHKIFTPDSSVQLQTDCNVGVSLSSAQNLTFNGKQRV